MPALALRRDLDVEITLQIAGVAGQRADEDVFDCGEPRSLIRIQLPHAAVRQLFLRLLAVHLEYIVIG